MKDAKVYFGDCKDKLEELCAEGIQVDLTVTSPPYDNLRAYRGSCEWSFDIFKSIANQLVRITKQGGGNCLGSVRLRNRWKRNLLFVQAGTLFQRVGYGLI